MSSLSKEKWPTDFEVSKVSESVLGQEFNIYLMSGILTPDQARHFSEDMKSVASHFVRDGGRVFVSVLATQEQIEKITEIYRPRAKNWRGQYYALANAIVDSCAEFTT